MPYLRRDIQAACFQRARHKRKPRQQVALRLLGHFPQTVVGGKISIGVAQLLQASREQVKVRGFLERYRTPVLVERLGHVRETPHDVQRQIDGIEFDMRQGMQ
ncbi:hypothetical protein D9M72_635540 [compost metagenome]